MSEVILKNISKKFGNNLVVKDINLNIKDGEFISLLGPSGCGKTTILRMISGLEKIDNGELNIDEKLYNNIPTQKRNIAMVFQSYALFPHMNVEQNVAFGMKVHKIPKKEAKEKIKEAIKITGLTGLETRYPKELSGGQRQRVALCRALVLDPKVLLLDEPLSNLDSALRERMISELKRLHQKIGKTIIYVTHNQVEAMTLSNRIAVMHQGEIVQCDTPNNIYNYPSCQFVATFIGNPRMNTFEAKIVYRENLTYIMFENTMINLEKGLSDKLKHYDGSTVKVGIRPQHIKYYKSNMDKRHSDTKIKLKIDMVESLGDKNMIICKLGETNLTFLADTDIELKSNDNVDVITDGRKFHIFDLQGTKRIL